MQDIIDQLSFRNCKLAFSNIHPHNPGLTYIYIGLKIFPVYLTVDSVQQRKRGMQNFKSGRHCSVGTKLCVWNCMHCFCMSGKLVSLVVVGSPWCPPPLPRWHNRFTADNFGQLRMCGGQPASWQLLY